ncbi:MAG: GntR family transcriptional regulator, partial [Rhodospirillaceae bacterium]
REALILLSEERLVDIFPQSRTVVAAIDVQRAREAHFLRRSVEVEIVRNLAPKISPRQIAELRVSVAQQQLNAADGDLGAFSVNDDRFHQLTYEYMNVGGLWELVRSGSAHLDRLRRLDLPMGSKVEDILVAHTAIVDALETGDPAAAEETVRAHLKGTVFAADAIRAHFPEYFEPVAEAVRAP